MQRAKVVNIHQLAKKHSSNVQLIINKFTKCTYASQSPTSSGSASRPWQHLKSINNSNNSISLEEQFQQDTNQKKLLLSAHHGGSYHHDDAQGNKALVFKSVREAEKRLLDYNLNHEYTAVQGVAAFCESAQQLVFGNSQAVRDGRIATIQTLGGTGALRLAAELLVSKENPPVVYLPSDAPSLHKDLFRDVNYKDIRTYKTFDTSALSMDLNGCLNDLRAAPKHSVVVLNAGADFSAQQQGWNQIAQVCKERELTVVFYNAQQGIISGNLNHDTAVPIRSFADAGGIPLLVCQSCSANFGLYSESLGALHVVCDSKTEAGNVQAQMEAQAKLHYSSPPAYGARVASIVLADPALKKQWEAELLAFSSRIRHMREGLVARIVNAGSKKHWNHITNQSGMYSHSGLSEAQVEQLIHDYHIYMSNDGCFNVARLNNSNIDYVANAFHNVTAKKE